MQPIRSVKQLESYRETLRKGRDPDRKIISVCTGTGCKAYKCDDLASALQAEVKSQGLSDKVEVVPTGCHGFCERGALMVTYPDDIFYQKVKPDRAAEIVEKTFKGGEILEDLLYVDPVTGKKIAKESDIPFYKNQQQELLAAGRRIRPDSLDDYLAIGGYAALAKVLGEMKPAEVIDQVTKSGLRGRGGGGFPAGVKWKTCAEAPGDIRYVICNADEGDPGAYMDRSLLEGNPHSVLEGMLIGAYAIGSTQGYVYVRNEYPLAVSNLNAALAGAREAGLLGTDILGSGMDFDVQIVRGGGAFVCGESTALMASIEGFVGEPRAKHIHTVEQGLYDKPSNLNNVETWANVPLIINKGVEWYTAIGTGDVSTNPWGGSKGTKIFSLVGKVNNTGLVEVPMGVTLRQIIYDIGGGVRDGKKFKGVQTGGPSGGCLPESFLDRPVDFDELTKAGSMMGSGGMIVLDEDTCMVDFARYFLNFLRDESCGKCTSCREGLERMYQITNDICEGRATPEMLPLLDELAEVVRDASLCALGQTAANPVLSTLRYYRDEYEAHIFRRECPAKSCKAMIRFSINERCNGCNLCLRNCPYGAITGEKKKGDTYKIDQTKCTQCRICFESCKFDAVSIDTGVMR